MRGEPKIVKQLLKKAKDSAMLAVEYYNKPAVSFKSEGYITMMSIAWTSLFHAYFLKKGIKPYYKKKNSSNKKPRYEINIEKLSDGKKIKYYKWWELSECIKQYFKEGSNSAVRKNLEFFIPLRNMIVHRYLPELDDNIFGECQALLLNFNNFIETQFGEKHSIRQSLSFSLQMLKKQENYLQVLKNEAKKKDATNILDYIEKYRSLLTSEQFGSEEYSFKAVLIQVKNHESKDALPIRFIHEKDLNDEQKEMLKKTGICFIKEKTVKIDDVPQEYTLTYKELCKLLKDNIQNFKQNKQFHEIKNKILKEKPHLRYTRKLDPRNHKSPKKDYYDHKIVEEFIKHYKNK